MPKTCYDRFDRIIKITRWIARVVGADVVAPNYKLSAITWFIIVSTNTFFACTIYTMYCELVIEGDWKIALQTLCLVGSAIQGISKLILCIRRRTIIIDISDFLYSVYFDYQQKDVLYEKVLHKCSDLTWTMLKFVLGIYVFVVCTIISLPLIHWLSTGEKRFIMQFLIPGLDPLTEVGYLTLISCQICLMWMGGFGNFAGDLYIFIFIINIPLVKDILEIKFQKLNEVILETHDPKLTMPILKEIVQWHQNYIKFVLQVEKVFYGVIFIQILTSVVGICCTIFSMIIGSWPAAFSYLFYSVFIMYAYCSLGHLVEVSNDGVTITIYTDCLWYELTVPEQKLVLLMLRKSQRERTLTIGQIMPLSMSTALQLTKCIYSYMMMLLNFLNVEEH